MKLFRIRTGDARQSTTEMMLMTSFLTLFIVGAVHLAMFAVTRYMVNLAAFSAARTVMVRGANPGPVSVPAFGDIEIDFPVNLRLQTGWPAAFEVMGALKWYGNSWYSLPGPIGDTIHNGRRSLFVTYRVPFGMPIFNDIPQGGLRVRGFAPYVIQEVGESGDNAK